MEQQPEKQEPPKPSFLAVFGVLEDGTLDHDLTEAMVNLVHDMRAFQLATGAKPKAKIAISLEIKLDGGIFEVLPSFKVVPPKKPRSRSIFYPTRDNGLSPDNQAQHTLALKDVVGSGRSMSLAR